uniref:hypothetical protein n=1 Tax=Eshraghiella crossota TaxID=45851 RepID=UPI00402632B3
MSSVDFFSDMTEISNYIFNVISSAWNAITSNWILMLSFSIVIFGSIIGIFRRVKNIRH